MPSEPDITIIGQTNFRGQHRKFGIYPDDRRRHVYVIGKTGVGKSTLLENMIAQDIVNGKGVCLVDPHGDTAEKLLSAVPPERINDVIYFDPSDVNYPIAFNVLEAVDPSYKYLVASGLVGSLKKIWADSWGPRLEYILRNTILALLDYPSSTILGILRMLSDAKYRKKVVEKISDPVVKAFWTNEFANYNERFRSEAISPIQNKVGQFLSSAIIRNIVAQPKSTIDMKDIMDNGKILLINVSKGKIGEDNSSLLGAMLINRIQLAAMDRASIPEEQRRDFYLYVDEFQNFATESFATILSEARKYRLNLTIAHQYVTQMEEPVRDAVFGNVGTIVSFRVGAFDAEFLEKEFMPAFTQTHLVNLDKYCAYIKLMINGITSKPFSMQTIPPNIEDYGKKETVISVSRERYGRSREQVEEKIARWSDVALQGKVSESEGEQAVKPAPAAAHREPDRRQPAGDRKYPGGDFRTSAATARQPRPTEVPRRREEPKRESEIPKIEEKLLQDVVVPKPRDEITDLAAALTANAVPQREPKRSNTPMFAVTCDRCGKATEVPFKPDPEKEVYCSDCFALIKEERRQAKAAAPAPVPAKPAATTPLQPKTAAPAAPKKTFAGPPAPPLRR